MAIWKATLKITATAPMMVGYHPVKSGDITENLPGPVSSPRITVPARFDKKEVISKFLVRFSHLSAT
jgi:hypothetical protein